MSALTEQVAREHQMVHQGTYIVCACDEAYATPRDHGEHLAQVTEQAVRANVAAEIREAVHPEDIIQRAAMVRGWFGHGMAHAARIADGKQP